MPTTELRCIWHLCRDLVAVITTDRWEGTQDPALLIETTSSGGLECPLCYLAYCNVGDCPILPLRRLV